MKKIFLLIQILLAYNICAIEYFSPLRGSEVFEIRFETNSNTLDIQINQNEVKKEFLSVNCKYGDYQISNDRKRVLYMITDEKYRKNLFIINGNEGTKNLIWSGFGHPVANDAFDYLLVGNSEDRTLSLYSVSEKKNCKKYKLETAYMKELSDYHFSYLIFPSDISAYDFFIFACEDGGYVCAEGNIASSSKALCNVYDNIAENNSYRISEKIKNLPKLW